MWCTAKMNVYRESLSICSWNYRCIWLQKIYWVQHLVFFFVYECVLSLYFSQFHFDSFFFIPDYLSIPTINKRLFRSNSNTFLSWFYTLDLVHLFSFFHIFLILPWMLAATFWLLYRVYFFLSLVKVLLVRSLQSIDKCSVHIKLH